MVVSGTRQTTTTTSPTLEIATPLTTNTKRPVSAMCNILTLTSCIKQASNAAATNQTTTTKNHTSTIEEIINNVGQKGTSNSKRTLHVPRLVLHRIFFKNRRKFGRMKWKKLSCPNRSGGKRGII